MTALPPIAHRAEVVVDLGAIRANIEWLKGQRAQELMVVVKANAYGHGMVEVARVAREAGVAWLGVATLDEALELRESGDRGRILSWLHLPDEDFAAAAEHGIDVTAYSVDQLTAMAQVKGLRVQLKIDSGLSRGGASGADWPHLVQAAAQAQAAGHLEVSGIWSHLASADDPDHRANQHQWERFESALEVAHEAGLTPEVVHLANSAGATVLPQHPLTNLVRVGLATYGLDPAPNVEHLPVKAAMTVRTRVAMVKGIDAGEGISYGHTFVAQAKMRIALVPLGYGDGIPRHASNRGAVWINSQRCPVVGRVCMDQFIVDLGEGSAAPGDEVIIFGAGDLGEPTADDWAEAAETINYEIVTRIGGRTSRVFVG